MVYSQKTGHNAAFWLKCVEKCTSFVLNLFTHVHKQISFCMNSQQSYSRLFGLADPHISIIEFSGVVQPRLKAESGYSKVKVQ